MSTKARYYYFGVEVTVIQRMDTLTLIEYACRRLIVETRDLQMKVRFANAS